MSEKSEVIIADRLTRRFGSFIAVNGISFTVYRGEIFGFLGANGAGKTTAIRMLTGLLKPSSGKASVAGYDVGAEPEQIKRNIGYMSQKFSLYEDLSIWENLRFYGGIYGLTREQIRLRSEALLQKLGLENERHQRVSALPLGWKQKLAFLTAMLHDPAVVFLDEPTSGVDPIARRDLWSMIYEAAHRGISLLVTTHYMDEAEYCDRVSIMVDGALAALDTPAQLKANYQCSTIRDVFVRLVRAPRQGNA